MLKKCHRILVFSTYIKTGIKKIISCFFSVVSRCIDMFFQGICKQQAIVSGHFKQNKFYLNSPQMENRFCQNLCGIILNISTFVPYGILKKLPTQRMRYQLFEIDYIIEKYKLRWKLDAYGDLFPIQQFTDRKNQPSLNSLMEYTKWAIFVSEGHFQ